MQIFTVLSLPMLLIQNHSTEPYFNQATEEYLLKHTDEDIFMLWRNDNAIVVGKHQNTLAEINMGIVNEKKIKVVRRLTGGGAVYHDLGNLNFTFIMRYDEAHPEINFKKFTQPIVDLLLELGISAEFSGRNDILIEGQKISGNAEHVFHQKKRILHHGTLLFSSQISNLSAALKVNPLTFEDKAVKSKRSRVTNISSYLPIPLSVIDFEEKVMNYVKRCYPYAKSYQFTATDIEAIKRLAYEKYSQWHWNFGYSPRYTFNKNTKVADGFFEVQLNVEKGEIESIKIDSNLFSKNEIETLETALTGLEHRQEIILEQLKNSNSGGNFKNMSEEELMGAFF